MTRDEFYSLTEKPLLLDGATGSNLFAAGMPKTKRPETWLPEHPEALLDLQRGYRDAGSRLVYAPTFTASRAYHKEAGDDIAAMNREMIRLSREAVPELFVLGDLTTVGDPLMDPEDMEEVYEEQLTAILDAGVDGIVIETMLGIGETVCAARIARSLCELPILCSFTVADNGMLYYGGTPALAAKRLEPIGIDAIGINCSSGPEKMLPYLKELKASTGLRLLAKPNAGQPELRLGQAVYTMTPEDFASKMTPIAELGIPLLGGCCGTTPAHIAALKKALG